MCSIAFHFFLLKILISCLFFKQTQFSLSIILQRAAVGCGAEIKPPVAYHQMFGEGPPMAVLEVTSKAKSLLHLDLVEATVRPSSFAKPTSFFALFSKVNKTKLAPKAGV